MRIKVWRRQANVVETMNLEDYLTHVLPREIFPSWPEEALKANAIMARTWAYYYIQNPKYPAMGADVCDTTRSQVYDPGVSHPRTSQAVRDTAGVVMVDSTSARAFPTFYSASCGGSGETAWNPRNIKGHTGCPCGKRGHNRHGHGHGGCQWGTNYLAQANWGCEEILRFYFKNFSLVSNYGIEPESNGLQSFLDSLEFIEVLGREFLVKKL